MSTFTFTIQGAAQTQLASKTTLPNGGGEMDSTVNGFTAQLQSAVKDQPSGQIVTNFPIDINLFNQLFPNGSTIFIIMNDGQ